MIFPKLPSIALYQLLISILRIKALIPFPSVVAAIRILTSHQFPGRIIGAGGSSTQVPQSPPESAKIAGTNALTTPSSKGNTSLPPRPPILKRTFSYPSPNKSFSRSSSSSDLAVDQYKWLRRMRDCMKEMNQRWDEVLPQEEITQDEEDKGTHDSSTDTIQVLADLVTECGESVSMERTGDSLVVHLKCPCSKGCKILLSGT